MKEITDTTVSVVFIIIIITTYEIDNNLSDFYLYLWVIIIVCLAYFYSLWKKDSDRIIFISTYEVPSFIIDKFHTHYPELNEAEIEKVISGLKVYFMCSVRNDAYIAMPSKVVDMLWHEFVLNTYEYEKFCDHAFGQFLHHIPHTAQTNEGLKGMWRYACKQEGIDSVHPDRMPLLFGIDCELSIKNGSFYDMQKAGEDWGLSPVFYHCPYNDNGDAGGGVGGESGEVDGGSSWWSGDGGYSGGDGGGGGGGDGGGG